MKFLNHYTLNTGDSRKSPRAEVSDVAIYQCSQWLTDGVHKILDGFGAVVDIHSVGHSEPDDFLAVSILRDGDSDPLVYFAVADTKEAAELSWTHMAIIYADVTDGGRLVREGMWEAPKEPDVPWCSVILAKVADIQGGIPVPAVEPWMADFERCMAWAWLERRQQERN